MKANRGVSSVVAVILLVVLTLSGGVISYYYLTTTANITSSRRTLTFENYGLYTNGRGRAKIFVNFKNIASSPVSEANFTVGKTTRNVKFPTGLEPGHCSFYSDTLFDMDIISGNSYPIHVSILFADGSTYTTTLTTQCQFISYIAPPGVLYVGGNIVLRLSSDDLVPEVSSTSYSEIDVILHDENYVYFGLNTGHLVKIDSHTFNEVGEVHFEHNPNRPVAADLQNDVIYAVGLLPPKLFKINATTMTPIADVTLTTWNSTYQTPSVVEVDQNAVYVACALSTGLVIKTDLNLQYVSKWETPYGEVVNMLSEGDFIYVLVRSPIKTLFKINATTMQTVDSIAITGVNHTSLIGLVADEQYLYVTAATPLAITKIAKTTLDIILQETYPSEYHAATFATSTSIFEDSLYVVAVKEGVPNLGGILRINTEDLEIAFERFDPSYQLYTVSS